MIAFSGGPDSTALLAALVDLAPAWGVGLVAAHLDHGLDGDSRRRAAGAAVLAGRLGVPFVTRRSEVGPRRAAGETPETAARRVRYGFLEEARRAAGARWVLTAHHSDDQAETVIERLLWGTGVEGMGGVKARHGRVVRPLLELSRRQLAAALAGHPGAALLVPVEDPTNRDPGALRNRVRHLLLPRLEVEEPEGARLARRLSAVAARARGAAARVERVLARELAPRAVAGAAAVERRRFEALPEPLRPHALALLHRLAGAPYPAGKAARRELVRQMAQPGARVGCDCGGGWRWEERGEELVLCRRRSPAGFFSYTLTVPGELEISALSLRVAPEVRTA